MEVEGIILCRDSARCASNIWIWFSMLKFQNIIGGGASLALKQSLPHILPEGIWVLGISYHEDAVDIIIGSTTKSRVTNDA